MLIAVVRYITAMIARSVVLTRSFQSSATATPVAANGTTTAPRLTAFSSFVISVMPGRYVLICGNMRRLCHFCDGCFVTYLPMRPEVEPWRALPASVATAIEPGLEAATQDILDAIGREVPAYARRSRAASGAASAAA